MNQLSTTDCHRRSLTGLSYIPGLMGLNDIKYNDWFNVIFQSLVRIPPLRDFFLFPDNYDKYSKNILINIIGEFYRKMWNPRSFKDHVSPHEPLQVYLYYYLYLLLFILVDLFMYLI